MMAALLMCHGNVMNGLWIVNVILMSVAFGEKMDDKKLFLFVDIEDKPAEMFFQLSYYRGRSE